MSPMPYSIVIATYQRTEPLRRALDSIATQTQSPAQVIVVDASADSATQTMLADYAKKLPLVVLRQTTPSSALQRNAGLTACTAPLVVFMDDDAVLNPDCMEKLSTAFDRAGSQTGGISARMEGASHPQPHGLLWWFYRWQAGYGHRTYGGHLFGAAINCIPCYEAEKEELVRGQWLPSTCVMYRTALVRRELFPAFEGYSFMEDVHLSARIARTHALYFHTGSRFRHEDAPSPFKTSRDTLARHRLKNQRVVATQVMRLSGLSFELKFLAHRLFGTISVLRRRPTGWMQELRGMWA